MKFGVFTLGVLFALVSSGAALSPLTPDVVKARASELSHTAWNGKSSNKGITEEDGCLMRTETIQVEDMKSKTYRTYNLLVQAPKTNKRIPVVIIVPTIRGTMEYLEPVVARNLCEAGMGSIIADVNDVSLPAQLPAWGREDVVNRKSLLALQTVVDFAVQIPQFDPERVGVIGLSLGAITTAMFAEIDPRLKASVIIVGGGNFPYILSHSDEPNVVDMREKRMKAAGLGSVDQYEQALRGSVNYDPFYLAPLANRHRLMMVMAESDTKVPYAVQQELFNAYGKPQSLTFTGGHVVTIVEMIYLYMSDVTDFLNDRFTNVKKPTFTQPITHKTVDLDKLGY